VWLINVVFFYISSFTCFGRSDHLQMITQHSLAWTTGRVLFFKQRNHYVEYIHLPLKRRSIKTRTNLVLDFNKKFFKQYFVSRPFIIIYKYFITFIYILVIIKDIIFCVHEILIVVSRCIDNVLLKMVVSTETCIGWKIKRTQYLSITLDGVNNPLCYY
jgi:hypothetical protein